MKKRVALIICSFFCYSCQQSTTLTPPEAPKRELRLSISDDPATIDPRVARDLNSITAIRMLFEGLMRPSLDGSLQPGIAESVEVSEDLKRYVFHLREAYWSNGDSVTAHDFEYAWKTILTPSFPAPNAYQLYLIKGARDAKEGKKSLTDVGIDAVNAKTLIVELEESCPYFLELTAFHAFFPVNRKLDEQKSRWSEDAIQEVIGNGPFSIHQWKRHNLFAVKKNPLYWDCEQVKLDSIKIYVLEENTALQLFESGGLEWAGSPLSLIPADAVPTLKQNGQLEIALATGTQWLRFNTAKSPLDHSKIRKALSYAIDRNAIVANITQGNQIPATGIVPPQLGICQEPYFADHNVELAKQLFMEALEELELSNEVFPVIQLQYPTNDRSHKIAQALQQQWQTILPIEVKLLSTEGKVLYSNVSQGDYQIALGSWFADFRDPMNFLEIFKSRMQPTNSTQWEDQNYTGLLEASSKEKDPSRRRLLLNQAESVLMEQMPVAPLFHYTFTYVKKPGVNGVLVSDLGFMDFKYATNEQTNSHQ